MVLISTVGNFSLKKKKAETYKIKIGPGLQIHIRKPSKSKRPPASSIDCQKRNNCFASKTLQNESKSKLQIETCEHVLMYVMSLLNGNIIKL